MERCAWCEGFDAYRQYHDLEWGVPLRDPLALFELLMLEGAQAGLSWATILKKRDNYRRAFDGFDPEKIARYDERKMAQLLADPGIVRNRAKVGAVVQNARAYLEMRERGQRFDAFLWDFVGGRTRQNAWSGRHAVPASTAQSDAMSKALKKLGFKFVGSTICYAFMQSAGLVNDHVTTCFRHEQVRALAG
ncbi:DNA-3-methyladenine glycosylase I [Pandoraea sp.]|uniref:DNA-3-methyladenine glycosylase I n=1 Tax=Pandoraea sp. TaxID=1883445 RepID=UPI00121D7224|nr:DNA-3-methyladenine glycosylase I [Pandoraea sp.]TAL52287.1 MAG: DNA-3-methyladenine glycosylase I [Pandoraea sp.]TAM16097.1 MAG: DNA-3-methyladenine glycosylase I [Pandoraea sp.]